MSIMDKSIASRIALLLGLFCLVLCAFLISLLQLLKMLSEEADETVNVALPNMAIASYISKESEWAKGILHDSILCRDRFVHLGVVQEIEARRFPENVLESLEALAVDPGIKEKIKNNLNELNGILAGTNQAVAQRIDNLRNTERLVKRIRTLNADLPQLERELYASGMKPGDPADESKIDKVFKITAHQQQEDFVKLMKEIPINHLELTKKIVEMAQKELNVQFDDVIYIGLTDHIHFVIKRAKQNEQLKNALLWEIKKFYPREFAASMKALELIEYSEGLQLTEDEASFIAMHFVNGQQSGEAIRETVEATQIIQDILNIIKFHYKIDLNENSINYSRFITHIRFFLQRIRGSLNVSEDDYLFEKVKEKYPDAYACASRIKTYLDAKLGVELTHEEMLYFMLHIRRLTEREKSQA